MPEEKPSILSRVKNNVKYAATGISDGVREEAAVVAEDAICALKTFPDPVEIAGGFRSYVGLDDVEPSRLDSMVKNVLSSEGVDVLREPNRFLRCLQEVGVSMQDACALCMIVSTDGFEVLISQGTQPSQADLNRVVGNAIAQTGLSKATTVRCVTSIALALGIAYDHSVDDVGPARGTRQAYVVPQNAYATSLKNAAKAIDEAQRSGKTLQGDAISDLELPLEEGLPKAKCYMGQVLLDDLVEGADPGRGLVLLEEASSEGDVEAAALLADWYYEQGTSQWGRALSLYTGYGALNLTPERRYRATNVINHRRFNSETLKFSVVAVAAMLVFVVIAPGVPAYSAHQVMGALLSLVAGAVVAIAWLHAKCDPYADVYHLPVVIFLLFVLQVAVRCLF